MNKKSGCFYTPPALAHWMTEKALAAASKNHGIKILEPSCGQGVFLSALAATEHSHSACAECIEIDAQAAQIARRCMHSAIITEGDFLTWTTSQRYDLIIGNPPYINKKQLTNMQRTACKEIHTSAGLKNDEILNIWTAFVVKSISLLNSSGILAFVLPTELLQVKYAEQIRAHLVNNFSRVEIITFKKKAFPSLEQDTVVLYAYKTHREDGFYFAEANSVENLAFEKIKFTKHSPSDNTKWTTFVLNNSELEFVKDLTSRIKRISDYCVATAGIVTAANAFFIVSKKTVDKYDLRKYVKPILQKGIFSNGAARFTAEDYQALQKNGQPCYLIDLTDFDERGFTQGLRDYLKLGEEAGIPLRYKCQKRQRWFDIPSIWKSEGFFFKRSHSYPKLLKNDADVYVTDAAYRIKTINDTTIDDMASSFYNSLTLLSAELIGRYYGGGVLELTPNEFKRLPLPYLPASESHAILDAFSRKVDIHAFLKENDARVLTQACSATRNEIKRIQNLYLRVKHRRLRK